MKKHQEWIIKIKWKKDIKSSQILAPIINVKLILIIEVDLNDYIKGNIFVTNAECYETKEEVSNALKEITAAVYIVLEDKGIILTSDYNLKIGIKANLSYAVGNKMSEEIMVFLENYEG